MLKSMHERSSIVKRNLPLRGRNTGPYYYSTNLVLPTKRKAKSVTVCVGAVCESGNCLVLGSDTRASYGKPFKLAPNDWTSKTYPLPRGCFASVAGTLSKCHGVSSQLAIEFDKLDEHFELDHVRWAINDARFYEYKMVAGDQIHATFGLSLSDWHKLPLNAAVYRGGRAIFRMLPLEVEIIVAGFKQRKPEEIPPGSSAAIFLRAMGKHPVELENNFTTIGSGGNKARHILDKRGQNPHRSWQRTVIDVIEAMSAAHRADRRHVGTPDDLLVIFSDRVKRFPVQATFPNSLLRKIKKQQIQKFNHFDDKTNAILESVLYDQPNAP